MRLYFPFLFKLLKVGITEVRKGLIALQGKSNLVKGNHLATLHVPKLKIETPEYFDWIPICCGNIFNSGMLFSASLNR